MWHDCEVKRRRLADLFVPALLIATAVYAADGVKVPQPPPPPNAPIELQIGLCSKPEEVERALALKPDGGAVDVWFWDTPSLAMFERGVRFRLRIAGSKGELTLKVANQHCSLIAPEHVPAKAGKCEFDRHGDVVAGAVSLSRKLDPQQIRQLIEGRKSLAEELSPAQVRYLREVLRLWPLPADLKPLGPIDLRRYRASGKPYDVDIWKVPSGARDVEIARKVRWSEADAAHRAMLDDLAQAKVAVCADQSAQSLARLRALLPAK
jgi:hypothetical protein